MSDIDSSSLGGNSINERDLQRLALRAANAAQHDDKRDLEGFLANVGQMDQQEKALFFSILEEMRGHGFSDSWKSIWQIDYERQPVDFVEWCEDPYYMGPDFDENLYPTWKKELAYVLHPANGIIEWYVTGAIGGGKCVVKDTLIQTSRGILRAEEVREGDFVLSESGPRRVMKCYDEGEKPSIKIRTRSGAVEENTPHHRHRVLTADFQIQWKRNDELEPGDWLVRKPGHTELWGDSKEFTCGIPWSEDLAEFLGLWVAEGWYQKKKSQAIRLCNERPDYVEPLMSRAGLSFNRLWSQDCPTWSVFGKIANTVRKICPTGARNKRVPDVVRYASRSIVTAFLRGYFTGDGGVSGSKIEASSASMRLLREIQILLWCLGIKSSIHPCSVEGSRRLWITDKWAKIRFRDLVGFSLDYKTKALDVICSPRQHHRDNDRNVIPYAQQAMQESWENIPPEYRSKAHEWSNRVRTIYVGRKRGTITLKAVRQASDAPYGRDHLHPLLLRILDEGLEFDEVVSVSESTGYMYDFSIDGDPSYVSNGFISHNTYASLIAQLYKLYVATCLKDPQKYYGIASNTEIVFGLFNTVLANALTVNYNQAARFVNQSGYFRDHCPADIQRSRMLFPTKNIMLRMGSSELHALGSNLLSFMIDEVNFMAKPMEKEEEEHQAYQIYNHTTRRLKSRYLEEGMCPGLACIVSSRKDQSAFLEGLMKDNKNNPQCHISDYAVWETKGRDRYSPVEFRVAVGNRYQRSELLDELEIPQKPGVRQMDFNKARVIRSKPVPAGMDWVAVPADFYFDFLRDMEGSLRDTAGVATFGEKPLIWRVESVVECIDPNRIHPFIGEWAELSMDDPTSDLVNLVRWDQLVTIRHGAYECLYFPGEPRFVHVDFGLTKDCAGIAMGCAYDKYIVTERDHATGQSLDYFRPKVWVDFMLQVKPVRGEQIDLEKIVDFILNLRNFGFNLQRVTFDGFASEMAIQKVQKANLVPDRKRQAYRSGRFNEKMDIESMKISVDRDDVPYRMLRDALNCRAVKYYSYPIFEDEVLALEHDIDAKGGRGHVDHPEGGCFVGDTRVPLLDGTIPTISELVDRGDVWVYSSDQEGRIVPGRARARMTKEVESLVDVILDSGAVVRCTPDHRFRLRDGSYKAAASLVPSVDRLMPINRTWPVNGGYERVTDKNGSRTLTHHAVESYFNGALPKGWVVHHLNGCKIDNRPENLERQTLAVHSGHHTTARHAENPSYTTKALESMRAVTETTDWSSRQAGVMRRNMEGMDFKARARNSRLFRSDVDLSSLEQVRDAENANQASRRLRCSRNVVIRVLREEGFADWADFQKSQVGTNHKVRAVVPVELDSSAAVYDLEVDLWANFALSCGVFVHNSKDVSDAVCGVNFSICTSKQGYSADPVDGIVNMGEDPTIESHMIKDIVSDYASASRVEAIMPPPKKEPKDRKMYTGRNGWMRELQRHFGRKRF